MRVVPVISTEKYPIKGTHIGLLKSCFKSHSATGKPVEIIFAVPPDRFEIFQSRDMYPVGKVKQRSLMMQTYQGPSRMLRKRISSSADSNSGLLRSM